MRPAACNLEYVTVFMEFGIKSHPRNIELADGRSHSRKSEPGAPKLWRPVEGFGQVVIGGRVG